MVRIAAFIVPLEDNMQESDEFLLVPYFGACIHTPPPPANQIVLVVPAKPAGGFRSFRTRRRLADERAQPASPRRAGA